MAKDAVTFIHALGFDQVDLFGFSMGGMIAQVIAQEEPQLVRKLILAGTGPAGGEGIDKVTRISYLDIARGLLTRQDPKQFLFFTRTPNGRRAGKEFLARLEERTNERDKAISVGSFRAQLKAIHRWGQQQPADLSGIRQPVLVANGESDRMVPSENSVDLDRRLPDSQLSLYPDAGHGGMFQFHERLRQAGARVPGGLRDDTDHRPEERRPAHGRGHDLADGTDPHDQRRRHAVRLPRARTAQRRAACIPHHFTAVLDDWDPRVIDGIAAKRHVITFDNRGVGASGGTVPHTIDEMAADAVAFIRALGYEQVDLLGFSLGGGVAQVITLEHPELVRRVILAGTGPAGGGGIEKITGSRPPRTSRPRSRCAIRGTTCSSTGSPTASAPRPITWPV